MSVLYAYVSTKTTVDPYFSPVSASPAILARNVSDGFAALTGGHQLVGQIVFFSAQRSVPNHLLCDGSEVSQQAFPELYEFIGTSEGTAAAGNFKLPNFLGSITPATTATPQTVDAGTVLTPAPTTPPPGSTPTSIDDNYGAADSGGRINKFAIP